MELLVIGVIALIILITVVVIYNNIISRHNAAKRAWADVITQERQKNKIIPHLESAVEKYKAYESSLQEKITQLRTSLGKLSNDKIDTQTLASAEAATNDLIKGINIAVENYPELKASEVFNNLMREIAEQQDNIAAAIRIFNRNVEDFNNGIEVFPNSLINSMLNKKDRLESFDDAEAASGFDFKPNL